ncbi:hypothetical protein [Mycolicibacterium mucogenicum]|uniref:hypothetical protein n=1 Tax=Mycolicibacterium mucogenicum TaxID=56689 RepID=UPI001F39F8C4|nr:hypothetical protein [Mycolicibacterium mucogenicum]
MTASRHRIGSTRSLVSGFLKIASGVIAKPTRSLIADGEPNNFGRPASSTGLTTADVDVVGDATTVAVVAVPETFRSVTEQPAAATTTDPMTSPVRQRFI